MKTRIATLALLFGLFISMSAFALEPVPASKVIASSIANMIEDEIDFPVFAAENQFNGDVVLQLRIEDNGTFDVELANCVDQKVKDYVVDEVEEMKTDKYTQFAGQTVQVKVSFKLKSLDK